MILVYDIYVHLKFIWLWNGYLTNICVSFKFCVFRKQLRQAAQATTEPKPPKRQRQEKREVPAEATWPRGDDLTAVLEDFEQPNGRLCHKMMLNNI